MEKDVVKLINEAKMMDLIDEDGTKNQRLMSHHNYMILKVSQWMCSCSNSALFNYLCAFR